MRHIITLLLMLPVLADAQIYIDSYRFGIPVPAPGLLLDSFPGAAAAYSLRKLDNDYTGNCIVVQRDNGDTSAIGFAGNFLDTAAMKTFCGEGAGDSCRVRLWYDQTGGGKRLRTTTADNQPLIMINGTVNYRNNNLVMIFDGSNDSLSAINPILTQNDFSVFAVVARLDTGVVNHVVATQHTFFDASRFLLNIGGNTVVTGLQIGGTFTGFDQAPRLTKIRLHSWIREGTNVKLGYDGVEVATATNSNSIQQNRFRVGVFSAVADFTGCLLSELILYESDQTSNRAAIETNINTFYSIY
jgi:hypothetical protein